MPPAPDAAPRVLRYSRSWCARRITRRRLLRLGGAGVLAAGLAGCASATVGGSEGEARKGQVVEHDAELFYASPLTAEAFLDVAESAPLER